MSGRWLRWSLRSLPLLLLAVLLTPGTAALAQEKGPDGLDYFHTAKGGAVLDFRGDLALPAGFFDEGSARFAGQVQFSGDPLGRFRGTETGNADTVVARREATPLGAKYPSRGSARIQLLALSLKSVRPLSVKVGGKTQAWDVKLALSSSRESTGTMEIVQNNARGGTFRSEFTVIPVLTFVRRSDKAERTLDVGKMQLSPATEKSLTLHASNAPWSVKAPAHAVVATSTFNPAVLNGVSVVLRHNPKVHVIEPAQLPEIGPGPVVH